MKKFLFTAFLVVACHLPVTAVYSHGIGQPPYFKVNGVFTDYYPVPTVSVPDFKLPNDIAVGLFLVNRPIEFEIDTQALPVPQEIIEKTTFNWEYGDGTKAQGIKNTYSYSKPGTYFIDIYAESGEGYGPQLLQSTAINVLPNPGYKLPKAVIEVNGKQSKDPLLDTIDVNFSGKQEFNGSKSDPGSSRITQYLWDMGDMTSREGPELIYGYIQNPYTVFPVLRIKTEDGFIADSFIQIKDENAFSQDKGLIGGFQTEIGFNWSLIVGGVLISLILAAILTWIISKIIFRKK